MSAAWCRRLALTVMATVLAAPELARADATPAPWSAAPTVSASREERTFRSGDTDLRGTLYLPQQRGIRGAVVVAHGASSPLRTSPLYRHLTEMLPSLGMAVFVYDRRGSGASGGDIGASDYAMLADDALAAVRMLKADPRLREARVGIWGLSQGGWLSLLAASRGKDVDFVVSISAPLVTPDIQMMFSSANALAINGYSSADIDKMRATRQAVDDYMRGIGSREDAQRMIDAAKDQPWFGLTYMGTAVSDRSISRWRREIEYDPVSTLETVRSPALILYGAADPVVPVASSTERINSLAASKPNLTVVVIAGADHSLETGVDPKAQMDPARADAGAPNAAEYFGVLVEWLTRQGLARGPGR